MTLTDEISSAFYHKFNVCSASKIRLYKLNVMRRDSFGALRRYSLGAYKEIQNSTH